MYKQTLHMKSLRKKEEGEERRGEKYRGHTKKLQIILPLATTTIENISEHEIN